MNIIEATVKKIDSKESLNIVNFDFQGNSLSMMSLEVGDLYVDSKVSLGVKPTNIAIGKNLSGNLSYSNQLSGEIVEISNGELLCSVKVSIKDIVLESIITTNSSKRMNLKESDKVTLFIKASDLSILEILND
ncbi:MAG: TOBE domain-containing protein [Campylobacterales bacterium]|nr:TOBE domain-containing protein [Campylobacterales bacterium]